MTAHGDVHAVATPWNSHPSHDFVAWAGHHMLAHWAWIPTGNVECLNEPDWDVEERWPSPEDPGPAG